MKERADAMEGRPKVSAPFINQMYLIDTGEHDILAVGR